MARAGKGAPRRSYICVRKSRTRFQDYHPLAPPQITFRPRGVCNFAEMVAVYLPDRSFQELFSAVRACSGVSCVVGMSDELPPPPVSKTRASQIALNFAGRVKHQMKDERKQVAWLPCPTASTTASPPGLLRPTQSRPTRSARAWWPCSGRS